MNPYVIPLKDGEKRPAEADWQLNTARMSEAAKRWPGVSRWGMPCGPINGVWILDIDIKTNGPGTLAELERIHGPLPKTRETRTQSGGRHLYFRWDPERPIGCWVGRLPGLDTRGPGGQCVIPPTPGYAWTNEGDAADAPAWLYEALRATPATDEPGGDTTDRPAGLPYNRAGALQDVRSFPPAGEGGRGASMWKLAVRLVRGHGLPPDVAADLIEEYYNPRCSPPWAGEELAGIERACRRAETQAYVPWGFTFYQGRVNDVLLRAIRRYGQAGKEGSNVPYRVYPDGRMLQLDYKDGLQKAILEVIEETGANPPSHEQLMRFVQWWRNNQECAGDFPKPLCVNDEPGPSIARIVIAPGPTDAWDEFLSRVDAPDTFLAWLWMLTLPVATRQVLWIHGDGADGKTVVSTVIKAALGHAATSIDDGYLDQSARWLGSQVFGKRLLVCDDTKMRAVLRRGVVHRITGRSPIKVEFKGVDGFDFEPNCAVMCTSNFEPLIGRGRADRTRLLPISVRGNGQDADSTWEKRLMEQFPALMHRAKASYEKLAVVKDEPQLKVAEVERKLRKASEADHEMYRTYLEQAGLVLDAEGEIRGREFLDRLPFKINSNEWHDFRQWLEEQGVQRVERATGNFWIGVKHV
jgi:hypothetical protein